MTPADHARAIHAAHPELGPSEIARRVAKRLRKPITRQQVAQAISSDPTRKGGRPPSRHVTVRVRVPRALLPWLDARGGDRAAALLAIVEAAAPSPR